MIIKFAARVILIKCIGSALFGEQRWYLELQNWDFKKVNSKAQVNYFFKT